MAALRGEDPFLARNTYNSPEKHFRFSREIHPFLARNTFVSRENWMLFSRELDVVLARNSSCTRRACQIGPTGIFLASEPYEPSEPSVEFGEMSWSRNHEIHAKAFFVYFVYLVV